MINKYTTSDNRLKNNNGLLGELKNLLHDRPLEFMINGIVLQAYTLYLVGYEVKKCTSGNIRVNLFYLNFNGCVSKIYFLINPITKEILNNHTVEYYLLPKAWDSIMT